MRFNKRLTASSARKQVDGISSILEQLGKGVSSMSCCRPLRGSSSSASLSHSMRKAAQASRNMASRDPDPSFLVSKL